MGHAQARRHQEAPYDEARPRSDPRKRQEVGQRRPQSVRRQEQGRSPRRDPYERIHVLLGEDVHDYLERAWRRSIAARMVRTTTGTHSSSKICSASTGVRAGTDRTLRDGRVCRGADLSVCRSAARQDRLKTTQSLVYRKLHSRAGLYRRLAFVLRDARGDHF